jgi:uncharacterized repeat protein (TIGR03803 family)
MKIKNLFITSALLLIANSILPALVSAQVMRLYGMTIIGGTSNQGVLFQYDPADSAYAKKVDFAGTSNGSEPFGSLMHATDGNLYGAVYQGGANAFGVLFKYDPVSSSYTKKLDFADTATGTYPRSDLVQASDGNLYGTTELGGTYNNGVIYKFDPGTSAFSKVHDFGAAGVTGTIDGSPYNSLMQASDGKLYGLTHVGGVGNEGVLYQYDPATSTYTKKIDFGAIGSTGPTYITAAYGTNPEGALVQATDGKLYGMTNQGGSGSYGVLFQYDPVLDSVTKKLDFGAIGVTGTTNGINPTGALLLASDSNLYGMTPNGGANNLGVLFKYNPLTSTYTKRVDFAGTSNGATPYGSLIQASDGNLYGMTSAGGSNNGGILFQFNPVTSVFTKKLDFTGTNGKIPGYSRLLEFDLITAVNNLSNNNNFSIAPNPATDQLTIHTPSFPNETITVSIMNVLGEIMQKENLKWSDNISMDIKNLHSGIYFLQLKTEKVSMVKRFVKE